MSAYTIKIENEDRPLERNIFIENENGIDISSWYGEESIWVQYGVDNTVCYTRQEFLELYEMMTVLKKYIDET